MISVLQDYAFACTHWALGSLVLVGLAASEYSGAGTIVALPIVAIGIGLSVLCGDPSSLSNHTTVRKRKLGDAMDFLIIWIAILEHLASAATCARVASATFDYATEGRLRDWLFGLQSHSLGEPWPDVLGVTITIVITGLFMLGLDKSPWFSVLLYVGVTSSVVFFFTVGGYNTDIKFWNWTDDFTLRSWGCVLNTAAMCSFGFANVFPGITAPKKHLKFAAFVLIPLVCYSLTSVIFTLMSHYRELAGTAIPLVRVFEIRDVGWARPVMALFTTCVVCVALTEIMPSLYGLFVVLAEQEWQVMVTSLLYRSSLTGAPVLAIFAAGSLSAILAFACPLSYLVRLLNMACLIKCTLRSIRVLYDRFKPEFSNDGYSVGNTEVQYSKLDQNQDNTYYKGLAKGRLKSAFYVLPDYFRKSGPAGKRPKKQPKTRKAFLEVAGDKEYLLLGDYTAVGNTERFPENFDSGSESEETIASLHYSDAEESSSSTDIDAAVQEYRDRVQVAAVSDLTARRAPTLLTSLIVIVCVLLLIASSIGLSAGISLNLPVVSWSALSVQLLSSLIIITMPQNTVETSKASMLPRSIFPVCAVVGIAVNVMLACTLVEDIWPGIICWGLAGLVLFWRCDCCTCEGLFPRDRTKIKISISRNEEDPDDFYMDKYIDTVLIAR